MTDFQPGKHWSHTLGRDIAACERRVYYRIWGCWGGWDPESAPSTRLLYTARHSKDLKSYAGTMVHEAIQRMIERVRGGLATPGKAVWLARFDERMRAEVIYSASRRWRDLRTPKRASLILYEHLTGADLHDWEVDEAVERAQDAFSSFHDLFLPTIREVGTDRIILIDSLDKMEMDGFDLYLSPDLVLLEGHETEIVDWKTGVGTNAEQLFAYAWYFLDYARRHSITVLPLVGRSVPLLCPEKELRIPIGEAELASVEVRILADIAKLREMAVRAKDGDLAFSKTSERGECSYCSFRFHCDLRPDKQSPVPRGPHE